MTTKQLMTGKLEDREFDAVMVCTGCYTDPHIPVFPGQQSFKGKIMHSHSYRTNKGFENQRVLIVGIGNTAGDIAVELSLVASKVTVNPLYTGTRYNDIIRYNVNPCPAEPGYTLPLQTV